MCNRQRDQTLLLCYYKSNITTTIGQNYSITTRNSGCAHCLAVDRRRCYGFQDNNCVSGPLESHYIVSNAMSYIAYPGMFWFLRASLVSFVEDALYKFVTTLHYILYKYMNESLYARNHLVPYFLMGVHCTDSCIEDSLVAMQVYR